MRQIAGCQSCRFHQCAWCRLEPQTNAAIRMVRSKASNEVFVRCVGVELDAPSHALVLVAEEVKGHLRLTCTWRTLKNYVASGGQQVFQFAPLDPRHKVVEPTRLD